MERVKKLSESAMDKSLIALRVRDNLLNSILSLGGFINDEEMKTVLGEIEKQDLLAKELRKLSRNLSIPGFSKQ